MDTYEYQAREFLKKTNTKFRAVWIKHEKYFPDDKQPRDIYTIILERRIPSNNRMCIYSFDFGQSIANSGSNGHETKKYPTPYDVLASIEKNDPGTLEDFCNSMGYSIDSKQAEKTYNAVSEQWVNIQKMFTTSELEELQEIN